MQPSATGRATATAFTGGSWRCGRRSRSGRAGRLAPARRAAASGAGAGLLRRAGRVELALRLGFAGGEAGHRRRRSRPRACAGRARGGDRAGRGAGRRAGEGLLVHGDRVYYRGTSGLTTTAPRPFTERPIRYEMAFGGRDLGDTDPRNHRIDDRNPLGLGFSLRAAALVNQPAHTVEYPSGDPAQRGPAGFGPIDAAWMPRRALAGTYDQHWLRSKKPLLPDDYDSRFAMCAPGDQQLAQPLVGGERVELTNLTREGSLAFELPRIALGFSSRFGRRRQEHGPRLATVLIEAEERRLSLVWQSALRVSAEQADYLDETEIRRVAERGVSAGGGEALDIIAVGARTPVGITAKESAASVRAGICAGAASFRSSTRTASRWCWRPTVRSARSSRGGSACGRCWRARSTRSRASWAASGARPARGRRRRGRSICCWLCPRRGRGSPRATRRGSRKATGRRVRASSGAIGVDVTIAGRGQRARSAPSRRRCARRAATTTPCGWSPARTATCTPRRSFGSRVSDGLRRPGCAADSCPEKAPVAWCWRHRACGRGCARPGWRP